jgi:hypothetical protein
MDSLRDDGRFDTPALHVNSCFDRWLTGIDDGATRRPFVRYYLRGTNEWRTATAWPVPGVRAVPYLGMGPPGPR